MISMTCYYLDYILIYCIIYKKMHADAYENISQINIVKEKYGFMTISFLYQDLFKNSTSTV